jgi:tetratricopeptide (TPR) repeat protein
MKVRRMTPSHKVRRLLRHVWSLRLLMLVCLPAAAQTSSVRAPDRTDAAQLHRAERLATQHRLPEARHILQTLIAAHPSAEAYLRLADVAREQDDLPIAMKSLQAAAKLDRQLEAAYLEFSEISGDHGNAQLALNSAEIGLENIPNSYRLKIQKGVALDSLGRFAESAEILKEAAAQQAENTLALLSLAVVLTHENQLDEANRILTDAINRAPQDPSLRYFHGKMLLQKSSTSTDGEALRSAAKQEFSESLRLDSTRADAWYQLSSLYSPEQQNLAEQALRHCLALDPKHASAQYALARLYVRNGRKRQGEAMLARYKAQQRADELRQNKQLRIDVAQR